MSAAEKLKALIEAGPRVMREGGVEGRWVSVDALPQIVAVVAAAENARANFEQHAVESDYRGQAWGLLDAALSALDEALGDVT